MKTLSFKTQRRFNATLILAALISVLLPASCKKNDDNDTNPNHPSRHSADVVDKWMTLQLRLMRNATGVPNHGFSRHFAYTGIAAFQSLAPGLTGTDKKWPAKWNGLTGLPVAANANSYYYPANANAALAAINRSFFTNAKTEDKAAIDSLETALYQEFLQTQPKPVLDFSAQFGQSVATAVFAWAETDGYKNAGNAYTAPTGPGLWKPTAPSFLPPATPYWGNNRTIITGSIANTQPAAPMAYSTDPSSSFYQMVKQVYDVSQVLTDDQKAMAIFWRDIPGVSSPGHWLSILQQVIRNKPTRLDKAALAYALTGTAINDALISCFQTKYQVNLVRPITYIREVMGHTNWNTYIGTPAHPEYSSAHSSLSAAAAVVLEELFGNSGSFTDHTYDYMGLAPRTYSSYMAIAAEAGLSRLYAGIHYLPGINAGLTQGRKVTDNIFSIKKPGK
jgi:hypothetical protein